jgi:hypothetical protein
MVLLLHYPYYYSKMTIKTLIFSYTQTSQWKIRANWAGIQGMTELFQSAVGIVGFGDIGMEIAKRCRAFDVKISLICEGDPTAAGESIYPPVWKIFTDFLRENRSRNHQPGESGLEVRSYPTEYRGL